MNAKVLVFQTFCLLYFCMPVLAEITQARMNELQALVKAADIHGGNSSEQQPYANWIMELSAEERTALIPILQQRRDKIDPSVPAWRENWNGLLAYLGDEEAMIANIENWIRWGFPLEVKHAESGQLPIYFEQELFRDEVYQGFGNPTTRSFGISEFILDYGTADLIDIQKFRAGFDHQMTFR